MMSYLHFKIETSKYLMKVSNMRYVNVSYFLLAHKLLLRRLREQQRSLSLSWKDVSTVKRPWATN